jgi:hypothetical protein
MFDLRDILLFGVLAGVLAAVAAAIAGLVATGLDLVVL